MVPECGSTLLEIRTTSAFEACLPLGSDFGEIGGDMGN